LEHKENNICLFQVELARTTDSNSVFLLQEPSTEYSQPRVSPYRLAAHLTSAFAIYCGLFWTALSVVMPEPPAESLTWVRGAAKVKRLALLVSLLVGLTAVSSAFVAGNDAVC
jgi:cytochrome c oxidase assembly protein subunit 15